MNEPQLKNSGWVGDGSLGGILTTEEDAEAAAVVVTVQATKRGTPFNVRLDPTAGDLKGTFYFEVEIQESTKPISIGVVQKEEFHTGWKTRGMFLNGNLTNGSAGLKIGFCDSPGVGDTVGVYVKRSANESLQVIFYINGRCLGPGFVITEPLGGLYPCLHTDGKAKVLFRTPEKLPTIVTRQSASYADPYSGTWRLVKAFSGPELGEFPLPSGTVFTLKFQLVDPKTYNVTLKLGNTMRTRIELVGKLEQFDQIRVNLPMSTRMLPNAATAETEQFISSALPELFKMIVSENGDLLLTGTTSELVCQRYEEVMEPLTAYTTI